eukprot:scaffold103152_cov30-Tisochrysis_lutea.AAC.3
MPCEPPSMMLRMAARAPLGRMSVSHHPCLGRRCDLCHMPPRPGGKGLPLALAPTFLCTGRARVGRTAHRPR